MKFFLTTQPPSRHRFPLRLPPPPPEHRSAVCVHACVCALVCVRVYFRLVFPFVFRLSGSWLRSSRILWEEFWPPLGCL